MNRKLRLWSFADVDRSGKVRWTARELGYEIEEQRLELGQHQAPEYRALNPYAQVPAVEIDGETWVESTAICLLLARRHPEAALIPAQNPAETRFWQSLSLTTTTLETPTVNYALSVWGVLPGEWAGVVKPALEPRLQTFAQSLPDEGFICGAFSLADICAGYVLRVGVQSGLLDHEGRTAAYLERLSERPAAVESRIFASLED